MITFKIKQRLKMRTSRQEDQHVIRGTRLITAIGSTTIHSQGKV